MEPISCHPTLPPALLAEFSSTLHNGFILSCEVETSTARPLEKEIRSHPIPFQAAEVLLGGVGSPSSQSARAPLLSRRLILPEGVQLRMSEQITLQQQ